MKAKSMILILIALGCGAVASIGISQVLASKGNVAAVQMADIYVAVADIPHDKQLDATMVKLEKWPADKVPEGSISDIAEIEGKFAKRSFFADEPILGQKITDAIEKPSNQLRNGFQAMTIKVDSASAAGLEKPGDRVDVLVYLRKGNGVSQSTTKTVLRDVEVFAVNSQIDRDDDESDGEIQQVKTVTLAVKPEQVAILGLAVRLGDIFLSLRKPNGEDDGQTGDADSKSLLATEGLSGRADEEGSESNNFETWLKNQNKSQEAPAIAPMVGPEQTVTEIIVAPPVKEKAWKMVVLSSRGREEYAFDEMSSLPTLVSEDTVRSGTGSGASIDLNASPANGKLNDDFSGGAGPDEEIDFTELMEEAE